MREPTWTLDALSKTKVGQLPANQAALAQTQSYGTKSNPMGGLPVQKPEPDQGSSLVETLRRDKHRKKRVVVCLTLIRCGMRTLDDDNLCASFKGLRDVISTSLGCSDSDRRLLWQYSQIETKGRKGTLVMIEVKHK